MLRISKLLAVSAAAAGVMLASAPAHALTVNVGLTAPAGPYNLANPVGNIPNTIPLGFFVNKRPQTPNNTYNFMFTVSPGLYDLHTTMSGAGPIAGPQLLFYTLWQGTPGNVGNVLLGTSPVALNPSIDVQDITGGNYYMQLTKAGIALREEWVTGEIALSVPEPATWAMMIMGLGLLGMAARRRRSLVPATATA